MRKSPDIEAFVTAWLAENLIVVPGHPAASDVDRLAADLTGAARAEGISGGDIHRALGDIDDYLAEQVRKSGAAQAAAPVESV